MASAPIPLRELQRVAAGDVAALDRVQRWVAAWGAVPVRVLWDHPLMPMKHLTDLDATQIVVDSAGIHTSARTVELERYRFSGQNPGPNAAVIPGIITVGAQDLPWAYVREFRPAEAWEEP